MSFNVEPLESTIDGTTLRGTSYTPRGPASAVWPTAVLYHGFSGNRVEAGRSFVQLARELVNSGIAVVAFDRAGHGESDGDFYDTTVSGDVAHSLVLLDRIAKFDFVHSENLHLLGLSMGAVIASVVAAETSIAVRTLTLWSVAAVFADEIRSGMLQGRSTEEVDEHGFFDFRGLRLGPRFLRDAASFDVYDRARGFGGPVRVLHGDLDFIPHSYAEAYEEVYGAAMQYTLVEGADHTWETVPARDFVINESVAFITAHASTHRDAAE